MFPSTFIPAYAYLILPLFLFKIDTESGDELCISLVFHSSNFVTIIYIRPSPLPFHTVRHCLPFRLACISGRIEFICIFPRLIQQIVEHTSV